MAPRQRIDRLLVERGLFESRAKAQAAIAAGRVTANEVTVAKPSDEVSTDAVLRAEPAHPWVSRGGVKLAGALEVNVLLTGKGAGEQPGERLFDFGGGAVVWIGHNTAGKARAVVRVIDGDMGLYGSRRRGDQLMRTGRHELVGGASKAYRMVGREGIQGKVTLCLRATLGDLVQHVRRQNAAETRAIEERGWHESSFV
jgi:hypothetical protein